MGTGDAVGPDEDDFHSLKRTTARMDQEEKNALKLAKKAAESTGGKQPVALKAPTAKKVVVF